MKHLSVLMRACAIIAIFVFLAGCEDSSNSISSDSAAYAIIYDGNGHTDGDAPIDSATYAPGDTVFVPGNTGNLAKDILAFSGWNTEPDGSGVTYTQGQTFFMGKTDIVLYARWTSDITHTITYYGNGNTGGTVPLDTVNYEEGQTVTAMGNWGKLVKAGYILIEWNTESDGGGNAYQPGETFAMGVSDVTLHAIWKWTKLFGVAYGSTQAHGIVRDVNGNSYITGYTEGNLDGQTITGNKDCFVIKYDASWNKQWTKLSGASGAKTWAYGIAVDASGNSYITGYTDGNLNGQIKYGTCDVFVMKYDSSGTRLWTKLSGSTGNTTQGRGIAADGNGNCYVAGLTCVNLNGQTLTGYTDLFVIKYSTDGSMLWTKLMGAEYLDTCGYKIAADSSGNSYVIGSTTGNLDGQSDTGYNKALIIKYDTEGNRLWTRLMGQSNTTEGSDIAIDSEGNSYITGEVDESLNGQVVTGHTDVYFVKYDATGTRLWTKLLGVADAYTYGSGIVIDAGGNIYITGVTDGNLDGQTLSGYTDVFVIKYAASGSKQSTKLLGTVNMDAWGKDIIVDANGTCYVTGYSNGYFDGQPRLKQYNYSYDAFVTERLND